MQIFFAKRPKTIYIIFCDLGLAKLTLLDLQDETTLYVRTKTWRHFWQKEKQHTANQLVSQCQLVCSLFSQGSLYNCYTCKTRKGQPTQEKEFRHFCGPLIDKKVEETSSIKVTRMNILISQSHRKEPMVKCGKHQLGSKLARRVSSIYPSSCTYGYLACSPLCTPWESYYCLLDLQVVITTPPQKKKKKKKSRNHYCAGQTTAPSQPAR